MKYLVKRLRMERAVLLAAALCFAGCERHSSQGVGPPPTMPAMNAAEEPTTITAFPVPNTLFDDHEGFVFEVTGPPAIVALEAHWSPNPRGENLSDETLLYATEEEIEKHNMGVWEEKSAERGSVVVLIPKEPTEAFELHFWRGNSGFQVDETLQSVLPEEAAGMRAAGTSVGSGAFVGGEVQARKEKTTVVGTYARKFESDDKTAWVVYRLTVTPIDIDPQTPTG